MSVNFLNQVNNGLPLTGFEPMRLTILRLLVRHVTHLSHAATSIGYKGNIREVRKRREFCEMGILLADILE